MSENSRNTLVLDASVETPLTPLEERILLHREAIENWFQQEWAEMAPPLYGSVDLRNAGFKIAPIDMNLFPAGFNNLNPSFLDVSVKAAHKIVTRLVPNAARILIIPESHTRNLKYWDNIKTLQTTLEQAGFEVRLGVMSKDVTEVTDIVLLTGQSVTIAPLERTGDALHVGEFKPDAVILNNDLSDGIPDILQNLKQALIPPAELGWSRRYKSNHFTSYADVAKAFAEVAEIDPWEISPLFRYCGKINFMQRDGMDCLIKNAESLFAEIKAKYEEHHIQHQPFLIIKADAGTYGMAVMTVRNIDELKAMNRKQRTRMSSTKGNQAVSRVIIQEGIYTFENVGKGTVAEPVAYLWGECVVGGFYRVHNSRGVDENLNTPGMTFQKLAFSEPCHNACPKAKPDAQHNRFYVYGIIARLSMLAAAKEIELAKQAVQTTA